MYLAVPARVTAIDAWGETATVAIDDLIVDVSLAFGEEIGVGDHVLVHDGYMVQKVSEEEAMRALELCFEEGLMA